MRETTSAIARVALLVIMTGMFAAAWSNDQQTQTAFIIARREAAQAAIQLAQTTKTQDSLVATETSDQSESEKVITHVTVEMTLPPDITPGRFRVVQPSGAMFTVNVSSKGDIDAIPRDVYVVEVAEGGRNCFIRIDQPDAVRDQVSVTASREDSTRR